MPEIMPETMTSMERVLTTLSHKEPDRVPLFLLLTMHGAAELGCSIEEYFSKAEHVVEGQLLMLKKYRHDCLFPFFYAPLEVEAFGGEVLYFEDGPPNSGIPIIVTPSDIDGLMAPVVDDTPCLFKVLQAIRMLKQEVADAVPIIGVVMSPFSLPVMQMGFPAYIELMYESPELFAELMRVNSEFCTAWANAQLKAGATAICYFDPISSPTMTARDMYLDTGKMIANEVISQINGPVATHLASGNCLSIIDDVAETGSAVISASSMEDLALVKEACQGKISILGNLNGIEMRRWTAQQAEERVRQAIQDAASGGGFILSDNHGEIPCQVQEETLLSIAAAVRKWGRYPLAG